MAGRTIVLGGDGTQAVTYQLPADLYQFIDSVVASVDASGSGDVRPTLYVENVNGVVIAAKRQGETIPAGDTGSATWALRLTDEVDLASVGNDVTWQAIVMRAGTADAADSILTIPTRPADSISANKTVSQCLVWSMAAGSKLDMQVLNRNARPYTVSFQHAFVQRIDVSSHETIQGNALTLAPGQFAHMDWAHQSGAALLNYAAPAAPTTTNAGMYAVMVELVWFPT